MNERNMLWDHSLTLDENDTTIPEAWKKLDDLFVDCAQFIKTWESDPITHSLIMNLKEAGYLEDEP